MRVDDASTPGAPRRARVLVPLIAASRLLKGLLLIGLGVVELEVLAAPDAAQRLREVVAWLGIDPHLARIDRAIQAVLAIGASHRTAYEIATFLYAALFLTEAIGLIHGWRWAEWLVVVSTTLLIPFEIVHVLDTRRWHQSWLIALNIAVAVYLYLHVRRRGKRAGAPVPATPRG